MGSPNGAAPGQPPRSGPAGSGALATLAPSQTPRDEYDLAYGYVLRKDYALAEDAFRGFLSKYPDDRLVGDATYWLGESMFQRQRYRDAAEAFLTVSTKYESTAKAPDALLRGAVRSINRRDRRPAVLYVHPWEFDPDQPRPAGMTAMHRFRHYVGLRGSTVKLARLLAEFAFTSIAMAFPQVRPARRVHAPFAAS